jgi:hypothetical protein
MSTAPRRMPGRSRRTEPPPDPVARLKVPDLLSLLRELRTAQLRADADGDYAAADVLERHLDDWLLELGYPPALPVRFSAGDLELLAAAAGPDDEDLDQPPDW